LPVSNYSEEIAADSKNKKGQQNSPGKQVVLEKTIFDEEKED